MSGASPIRVCLLCITFLVVGCAPRTVLDDELPDDELPDDELPDEDPPDGEGPQAVATVDVLVVGGGPAGMAAAIEAADLGASVILLERESTLCSWGACLVAKVLLSGTPEQEAMGIVDSAERLLDEWPEMTGGDPDEPWVRAYAEQNVPGVRDWLADLGVQFALPIPEEVEDAPTHRFHTVAALGSHLEDRLKELLATDDIRRSHEVTGLVLDADGAVIGAAYTDTETGSTGWIEARNTVMATGSFLRDLDKVRTYRTDLEGVELWFNCMPGADGAGHTMLEEVGAGLDNPAVIGLHTAGVPNPLRLDEVLAFGLPKTIWVNSLGERFTDEAGGDSFSPAEAVVEQPDGVAWAVLDGDLAAQGTLAEVQAGGETLLELLDVVGYAVTAPSLDELAVQLGFDAERFASTVAAYNAYTRGEVDDPWREGEADSLPIEVPPFAAVWISLATAKAFGGVAVDLDGRVIDTNGSAMTGLLAAGELTGMAGGSLVGDRGFEGSISAVVLSGRIAGATAADDAARSAR